MGFDNTKDNRWRPDLESAQRRVREEEHEDAEREEVSAAIEVVYSRELSFVPRRRVPERAGHDAQTLAL